MRKPGVGFANLFVAAHLLIICVLKDLELFRLFVKFFLVKSLDCLSFFMAMVSLWLQSSQNLLGIVLC
jgi:hypothetical protein